MNVFQKSSRNILLLTIVAATGYFFSCKPHDANPQKAENPLDAGREFIRASLDGNYKRASYYLLKDSVNENLLTRWEESYRNLSSSDRASFREASIVINSEEKVNDSISIINFSNSFKRKSQVLKVVKSQGDWVVDFKYTFSGNF